MTIFGGVCGVPLGLDGWPADLREGQSLREITGTFRSRLKNFPAEVRFRVRPVWMKPHSIRMRAVSAAENVRLRGLRNALRDLARITRDDHDAYGFHVSIAYPLVWFPEPEAKALFMESEGWFARHLAGIEQIDFGAVEFCVFDTMMQFEPLGRRMRQGFAPLQAPAAVRR